LAKNEVGIKARFAAMSAIADTRMLASAVKGTVVLAGATVYSVGEAATSVISQAFDAKPEITKFTGLGSVDRLYNRNSNPPAEKKGAPPCMLRLQLLLQQISFSSSWLKD
jgi:hypothetical protein